MTQLTLSEPVQLNEEFTACYDPKYIDGDPDIRVRVVLVYPDGNFDVEALTSGGTGEYDTQIGQIWTILQSEIADRRVVIHR